ncbi:MAG TPA: glycoside hydrolase family 3 N-terminal domain-containing protein [Acidimicrobiales bacterium]|nr:glycoside hydrolase family 3 N-terminal domain-containing protein [Acidimicrobiales bacterium]
MDVDDLLGQMTLEEKAAQLTGVWYSDLLVEGQLDDERMTQHLSHGIGQITRIAGTGFDPVPAAEAIDRIQRFLEDRTRLGIPALAHEEALSGLMAPGATNFPQAIGLASTWDPVLVEEVAVAIGRQVRAVGARLALSPVLDIARDPRWGRLEETYGEDPELVSRMGVAYVRGVQSQGVDCCGKHFLGHASTLGGLNHGQVVLGPRRLRDVEAVPFRAAIHEAGLATVMNAYNDLDGLPIVGSPEIMTDLLRGELGFEGCVVADYYSIDDLDGLHHIVADREEAARMALSAGIDVELPSAVYYATLADQVRSGRLDEAVVDQACRRVLEEKLALGLFDERYVGTEAADGIETVEDVALARRASARSIVLLTNDGTLPLAPGARVAVLGPSATDTRRLYGDYSYPGRSIHLGVDQVVADVVAPNDLRRIARRVPAPRQALAERYEVVDDLDGADVAVVIVGGQSGMSEEDTSGEFRDASDLRLPPEQLDLIATTAASGVPTVVVVVGGRAHSLAEVVPHAAALVLAWLPGDEGGRGLVDVLSGDVDAGGRLPVSLLHRVGQVGGYPGHHHGGGRSLMYGDYVDGPVAPLFPFGHGLSYTSWSYDDVAVAAGSTTGQTVIDVALTNTGDREGEEVIQVFARDELASVGVPARRLVAFQRVGAEAGETVRVRFTIPATSLGFHGVDLRFRVEPGDVTFLVGPTATTVTVTGDVEHPDPNAPRPFTVDVTSA